MLGDVAIAVHPKDERYPHLHGQEAARCPSWAAKSPSSPTSGSSREFGTGAVKVTPAHDPNDFALGQRHNLPSINVMDETAHINAEWRAPLPGSTAIEARKTIVARSGRRRACWPVKDHANAIGKCDRCKTIVEPRLSTQWFIKIQPLADQGHCSGGRAATSASRRSITRKTYVEWMRNIHDWCISRQLWWGHRIPAWHCAACDKITVAREDADEMRQLRSEPITQETDVLDTWFSSGLLPFTVFGWPDADARSRTLLSHGAAGHRLRHPLLLGGAHDHARLPLHARCPMPMAARARWRMRCPSARSTFTRWCATPIARRCRRPRATSSIRSRSGKVRDRRGAVHAGLHGFARHRHCLLRSRTEGYRAFANKIWNAARFMFMNLDRVRRPRQLLILPPEPPTRS